MHSDSLNNNQTAGSSPDELVETQRLNKREEIVDDYGEEFLFLSEPEFDVAIIGVAKRIGQENVIAYDYNKVCDVVADMLGDDDPFTVVEYVEFNIIGAYVGERTPIFVDVFKQWRSQHALLEICVFKRATGADISTPGITLRLNVCV